MSSERLDDLLALERGYDDFPEGAEARILAGVEAALGGGPGDGGGGSDAGGGAPTSAPPAGPPGATSAAPWIAKAAYVAIGIVAGASGHAVIASATAPPAPTMTVVAAPTTTTIASATAVELPQAETDAGPALTVQDLPDDRPRPAPVRTAASATRPSGSSRSAEERAELDVARAALARGRVEACLEALERHARTYGEGQLAEEREVLAVQALVSAGRKAEASERARRFQKKYPNSLFGPAVAQAIASGG